MSWTDTSGNFWIFGGNGYSTVTATGDLNDIWEYQPSSTPSFPTTATPVLSPSGGAYSSVQSASITDTTPGAAIYYTTDGSTPTTASTQYNGPFPILGNETIQAVAVAVNYLNSAIVSANYTMNVAPDFDFAVNTSLIIAPGGSGAATVTVTPEYGFTGAVSFTCSSGLPAGATCSFSPATATSPTYSTTLTVNVPVANSALRRDSSPLFPVTALAGLVCSFGLRKRRLQMLLLLAVSIAGMGLLTGCGLFGSGGSGGGSNPPEPITYTVTLTAKSGTLSHTSTFLLTVTTGIH